MYLYLLPLLLMSDSVWAKSVKGIADKFLADATQIGLTVSLIGLLYGGVSLATGKQGAGMQLTCSVIGITIILGLKAILSLLQGIV